LDITAAAASSLAGSRRFGPHSTVDSDEVSDVVLCFDENLRWPAAVMLESLTANAQGPVRLWVLGRALSTEYQQWLAAAFPELPMTFLPCDHIDYGPIGRMVQRVTVSTMDRLLLPHLLEDIDRVVYLDIDTLVLGDIGDLAHLDLHGHPVAARDSSVSEFSEWRLAAKRLPQERAGELQRRMGVAHGYGHPALNAGVLVLDLDRMRRDDFTATYVRWVERYGLHDQDVMLAYAGSDRVALEPRWNALPVLEDVADPALIHWAKLGKPWEPTLTYRADLWLEYADRLRARVGSLL
jgi:lipopolysaccharide biosynthesis glycosyltransferase